MTAELTIVLVLLAATVAMFLAGRPRMDVVALLALVAMPLTGILTINEAIAGFSDPNVILIGALFVLGDGLVRAGVARRMGDWLIRRAGTNESRLIVLLMLVVATLGATMSSTGVVAIFIPVALRVAYRMRISPSRLMMPLSFAGLISGMLTLVATPPNLVVNAELTRSDLTGFGFFSFTPFGLPILVLGIGYMLIARRYLPGGSLSTSARPGRPSLVDFVHQYRLEDRQFRVRVLPGSLLAGRTLADLALRTKWRVSVVAIEKPMPGGSGVLAPARNLPLEIGDTLLLEVLDTGVEREALQERLGVLILPLQASYFSEHANEVGMAEVLLPPESEFIGRSVVDIGFRTRYGLTVVGLRRNLQAFDQALAEQKLQAGDTLLLVGSWRAIRELGANPRHFVILNLPAELDEHSPADDRAPYALLCLALMVVLMIGGFVPNVLAALIACLAMGLFGVVTMESAYRSVHWPTLILIIGMLPFATALQKTGGIDLAATAMTDSIGQAGPYAMLAGVFLATMVTGLFVSNTATAVLMAPLAISAAQHMGFSPYPFAMIVALASSTAFITPVSSPVNTLVVEPGGYRFMDFVRIGLPFSLLVMIVSLPLVAWLLPLTPR